MALNMVVLLSVFGGGFVGENFLEKSFPQAPFKNFQLFLVAWFVAACAVMVCSDDLRGALPTGFGVRDV
jgi:hypothetical protein